jgi:hypothetical protein
MSHHSLRTLFLRECAGALDLAPRLSPLATSTSSGASIF